MTLCIIDMQSGFSASKNDFIINNVKKYILESKRNKEDIILLEYIGAGCTNPEIIKCLEGYNKFVRIMKSLDDGHRDVIRGISRFKINAKHIKFCGVNTCQCVADTFKGLLIRMPNTYFTLLRDAVNCMCISPKDCIDNFYYLIT